MPAFMPRTPQDDFRAIRRFMDFRASPSRKKYIKFLIDRYALQLIENAIRSHYDTKGQNPAKDAMGNARPWAPSAPNTIAKKRASGHTGLPLRRTDAMYKFVTNKANYQVKVDVKMGTVRVELRKRGFKKYMKRAMGPILASEVNPIEPRKLKRSRKKFLSWEGVGGRVYARRVDNHPGIPLRPVMRMTKTGKRLVEARIRDIIMSHFNGDPRFRNERGN